MSIREWESLLETLDVQGTVQPVPAARIEQFVASTGFELPSSYREYCQVFGPGVLTEPSRYKIAAPEASDEYFDLSAMNAQVRRLNRRNAKDPEQFDRAWYFSVDCVTSFYFWDPLDITVPSEHEYGIYVFNRDWTFDRVADTFWSFISEVCMADVDGEPAERVFEPRA